MHGQRDVRLLAFVFGTLEQPALLQRGTREACAIWECPTMPPPPDCLKGARSLENVFLWGSLQGLIQTRSSSDQLEGTETLPGWEARALQTALNIAPRSHALASAVQLLGP